MTPSQIDREFYYEGNDLGLTLKGKTGDFKCWSHDASKVELLLFRDSCSLDQPECVLPMIQEKKGTWSACNVDYGSCTYYKFRIWRENSFDDVCDIWAKCCSADSVAAQIADIGSREYAARPDFGKENFSGKAEDYYNPFGDRGDRPLLHSGENLNRGDRPLMEERGDRPLEHNSGDKPAKYSDAVIYEMHIRDWSRAYHPDSTGKFNHITAALESPEGFACHLKDLGITHVQILPMFDYAQTNSDPYYNWGYNPYHYNVPEGRYVQDMKDGTDAVVQLRKMIAAFHKNGIAVSMDVVYNHTNGTGADSLYDRTVAGYFYRMEDDACLQDSSGSINDGSSMGLCTEGTDPFCTAERTSTEGTDLSFKAQYSNGSGCGNETATNHLMVKKYVIDSLRHWMLDYHINGFRFDLMGVHEKPTMAQIYAELCAIDPNVMVYGEPWTGGSCAVQDSADQAILPVSAKGVGEQRGQTSFYAPANGVGAFEDSFRDAIKGAEFGGFQQGQLQGCFKDQEICNGLTGSGCQRNSTGKPELAIHYAECHDNYTLFDKLSISLNGGTDATAWKSYDEWDAESQKLLLKQQRLAAAYIFLSQGTPFINGGQEFLRTKKGNPDSYSADFKGGIQWTNEPGNCNIDEVNSINLEFKKKFGSIYNTYRGLIHLRKDFSSSFGSRSDCIAQTLAPGVTLYKAGEFVVVFNATKSSFDLKSLAIRGNAVVIDGSCRSKKGYSIASVAAAVNCVEAMNFVIVKQ